MALDDIKVIAKNIKAELGRKYPKYGFSVSSERGITDSLYVNWYSADFNPFTDPDTKEAFVNAWRSNEPDERFNEKGNNVVRYIIDTVNKYYKSSGDAYHTRQNFYRNIKVGTYAKPFTVVGSSSGSSGYRRSSGSTQQKGWDFGFLVYECSAGWNIYKKTLNDGRLVFNVRKLPETAPNKTDWAAIRGEMYTQVGFKWNPRGQAFERWGSISNEESTFSEICKTLSKYYKVSQQPETPQSAPEAQPQPEPSVPEKRAVNESYKSIPDNPYLDYFEIKWAEGMPEYIDNFPKRFKSFKQATKYIADNIIDLEEGGYDKHGVEWAFKSDPTDVHNDRWDVNTTSTNPNTFPNLWAKEQLQGVFWHVLHYSDLTPDHEQTKEIDNDYFNLTKKGIELTNDEFQQIVDYVTSMKYYKKESFPKYIYSDERKERLMEMFPKLFSLFAEAEEAPAVKSRADIEKAIKGLRVLANAGNEKAAKAIKGLEILLKSMPETTSVDYSQLRLMYSFPPYKRKPAVNVLYSPDITQPVKVGGAGEKGYKLVLLEAKDDTWQKGKTTDFVITERELNELIENKNQSIQSSGATVYNYTLSSGGYMAGGGYPISKDEAWYVYKRDDEKYGLYNSMMTSKDKENDIVFENKSEAIKYLKKKYPKSYSDKSKMASGGQVDLFEHYDQQPEELREILERYESEEADYEILQQLQQEVEAIGYTFEYGLDAEPFGLRPIGVPLNELEGYENYASGGYMAKGGGVEPIPDDFEYRGSGDEPYTAKFVNKNDGTVLSVSNFVVDPISNKMYRLSPQEALYRHFEKSFESGGYMAEGGKIKDQYVGKTPKEVYEMWNYNQKYEFFKDHFQNMGAYTHSEYKRLPSKKYDELDEISKTALLQHIKDGQYESGGYMAGGGKIPDWLFIGTYPNAYIYYDKRIEEKGEYHEIGRITFSPLKIEMNDDSKKYSKVVDMILDEYENLRTKKYVTVSTTGQKAPITKAKRGARLKSAIMRDRKYKSDEPHEQAYSRKRRPKNRRYSK